MCLICVELMKGRMTIKEASVAIEEIIETSKSMEEILHAEGS